VDVSTIGVGNVKYFGHQSNYLAWADKRFTVSFTKSTNSAQYGADALESFDFPMTNLTATNYIDYLLPSADDYVEYHITLPSVTNMSGLGIALDSKFEGKIKYSVYNASLTTWFEKEYDINSGNTYSYIP